MKSNNLRLLVGNEFFDESKENYDDFWEIIEEEILDPPEEFKPIDDLGLLTINFPDLHIEYGLLYMNMRVEEFMSHINARGFCVTLVERDYAVFPSSYRMEDGKIYWGTDVTLGLLGSVTQTDVRIITGGRLNNIIPAYWDEAFRQSLKNTVAEFWKEVREEKEKFDKVFDYKKNPAKYIVGQYLNDIKNVIDYLAENINNPQKILEDAKTSLGNAFEYAVKNPYDCLMFVVFEGASYVLDVAGRVACDNPITLPIGIALFYTSVCVDMTFTDALNKWNKWKKEHGNNLESFISFWWHYGDFSNPDNIWNDLWNNMTDNWIVDFVKSLLGINDLSWDEFYNALTKNIPPPIPELYDWDRIIQVYDCQYNFYDHTSDWLPFFRKYYIVSIHSFSGQKVELYSAKLFYNHQIGGYDVLFKKIENMSGENFVDRMFNKEPPFMVAVKNWSDELESKVDALTLSNMYAEGHTNFIFASPYPIYIWRQLYQIPKIRVGKVGDLPSR